MPDGWTSPSEGNGVAAMVEESEDEKGTGRSYMRVDFACNVNLPPAYPQPLSFHTPQRRAPLPLMTEGMIPKTIPRVQTLMLKQRRWVGLIPPMNEMRNTGGIPITSHTTPMQKRGRSMHSSITPCGSAEATDTSLQLGDGDLSLIHI